MNPRAEVWNILHDGEIVRIEGEVPGDVFLTINIPYLRRMFSKQGENIILALQGCTKLSMKIWDVKLSSVTEDFSRIVETNTGILSTESLDVPVHVVTTEGEIDVVFQTFSLRLDDGSDITFQALCDACEGYWARWNDRLPERRE